MAAELLQQHPFLVGRGAALHGGEVEEHDQHPGPLHVAEELVAEPPPFRGTLDEPGDVGHDELAVSGADHAEVGHQRGERVVGDLRLGRRDRRDQGRFPGVGKPDESDVGDQA